MPLLFVPEALLPHAPKAHRGKCVFCSWNTRALCHRDEQKSRKRAEALHWHSKGSNFVFIQESHGSSLEVTRVLRRTARDFHMFHSCTGHRSTGGVITLVAKSSVPCADDIAFHPIIPGRVTRCVLARGEFKHVLWNIHNEKLMPAQMACLIRQLSDDLRDAQYEPLRHVVTVAGDFNFLSQGESPFSLDEPHVPGQVRRATCQLAKSLSQMTELHQQLPTHYCAKSGCCSRLDRIYSSLPGWALKLCHLTAGIKEDPFDLHKQGISDHAPIFAGISFSRVGSRGRPLDPRVCALPRFAEVHDRLVQEMALDSMEDVHRWRTHKEILKHAAKITLDELFLPESIIDKGTTDDKSEPIVSTLGLAHIARVVFANNTARAKVLLERCAIARRFIRVNQLAQPPLVELINAEEFREKYHAIKAQGLQDELNGLRSKPAHPRSRARTNVILRLAKLWSLLDAKACLAGVLRERHPPAAALWPQVPPTAHHFPITHRVGHPGAPHDEATQACRDKRASASGGHCQRAPRDASEGRDPDVAPHSLAPSPDRPAQFKPDDDEPDHKTSVSEETCFGEGNG